jgi:hypothetical protein
MRQAPEVPSSHLAGSKVLKLDISPTRRTYLASPCLTAREGRCRDRRRTVRGLAKASGPTVAQVSERAGITRNTLRRIETGDPGVGVAAFLSVARALGVLDLVVTATDPYETDLGRTRADEALPKRVRQ